MDYKNTHTHTHTRTHTLTGGTENTTPPLTFVVVGNRCGFVAFISGLASNLWCSFFVFGFFIILQSSVLEIKQTYVNRSRRPVAVTRGSGAGRVRGEYQMNVRHAN